MAVMANAIALGLLLPSISAVAACLLAVGGERRELPGLPNDIVGFCCGLKWVKLKR